MILIDLTGKKIGRLTVKERVGTIGLHPSWLCFCECGNEKIVRGDHLRNNLIQSCGCLEKENRNEGANYIHGGRHTRIYSIWTGMLKRCTNSKCIAYKNYGGRGIEVCSDWLNFVSFKEWAMANGYDDSLSIDRINNNGNYEPSNCKWSTPKQQANNRRKRKPKREINNGGSEIKFN